MSWLVSLVITSMLGAALVVKICDTIFGGIIGPTANAAKASIFVSAWTALTTLLGIRSVKKTARNLRQGGKEVGGRGPSLKGKRFK